ncbi:MAG: SPOR domain-containing protein [Variibacter sp.]|nr:SPOR domain-containing protein [Variibacter sp.]
MPSLSSPPSSDLASDLAGGAGRRAGPDLRGSYDPLADLAASAPRRRRALEQESAAGASDLERPVSGYRRSMPAESQELASHRTMMAYRAAELAHHPAAASNPSEPLYAQEPHGYDSRSYADDQAAHTYGHADAHAAQPGYADPHHVDPGYDPAAEYDYDPAYAEPPPVAPRRRGGVMVVAAVLGVAAIGTAGAFAYRAMSGGNGSQPPVIKANSSPAKVAAAPSTRDAGGRTTYDRNDKSAPERMQSREEQPMQLAEVRPATPRVAATGQSGGASSITAFAPTAGPAPAQAPSANEPKRVKTIPIRPDGSVAPESAVRSQNTGSIGRAGSAPAAATPNRTSQRPGPVVASAPAAAPDAGRSAAGMHVVQVASQKTEEDAHASFRALQAKYPTVLGDRQPLIRKTDLGSRGTFYRVQVGPFASADQANEMCGNLKAAGGQCIVQKN